MTDLPADVRYAWRRLRATPAFSVTAVLTLALGIGTTTAVFGVVDALSFRPVAGLQLDGAYAVTLREQPRNARIDVSWSAARALHRKAADAAIRVAIHAGYWTSHAKLQDRTENNVASAAVGGDFAEVYGLHPLVGRWLGPEDDNAVSGTQAAVISERIWRAWYGARPDIVGRETIALRFNRGISTVTIVGVAAAGFRGLSPQTSFTDLWVSHATIRDGFREVAAIDKVSVISVMRPPPQMPIAASAALATAALASVMPSIDGDSTSVTLTPMRKTLDGQSLSPLRVAALAVSWLVLVAACANLANMLLARGAHRAGEVAIRLALGASRTRIARIFIAEIGLIAGLAAATGIGLAAAGLRLFGHAVPTIPVAPGVELTPDLTLNVRMLIYALLASATALTIVGVIAVWRGSATAPGRKLATSSAAAAAMPRARALRTGKV